MKKSLLMIAAIAIIGTSCKKDPIVDTCVPPALKKNIIGKWTVNRDHGEISTSTVEFLENGKYIDDDRTLVILGGDPKLYQVQDSTLTIQVGTTGGVLNLTQSNCDSLHFSFINVDIGLFRQK